MTLFGLGPADPFDSVILPGRQISASRIPSHGTSDRRRAQPGTHAFRLGPRITGLREYWLAETRKRWADPLMLWSVRNLESVRESFSAAGWSGARWEDRLARAKAIYRAYAGPKVILEHERITGAIKLFDAGEQQVLHERTGDWHHRAMQKRLRREEF